MDALVDTRYPFLAKSDEAGLCAEYKRLNERMAQADAKCREREQQKVGGIQLVRGYVPLCGAPAPRSSTAQVLNCQLILRRCSLWCSALAADHGLGGGDEPAVAP